MSFAKDARKLANYILSLEDGFKFYSSNSPYHYNHIGALLTNIVLQAGLNYNTVVKPRVNRLLLDYPEAYTINKFQHLIEREGLNNLIQWENHVKLNRMYSVISFLSINNVDTCLDLKNFLKNPSNQQKILELEGIGPKTLDYLMKLLNFDVVAVDRHIYNFVEMADIRNQNYHFTKKTVEFAADFLNVSRTSLDYSIWNYMSKKEFSKSKSQLKLEFA